LLDYITCDEEPPGVEVASLGEHGSGGQDDLGDRHSARSTTSDGEWATLILEVLELAKKYQVSWVARLGKSTVRTTYANSV
jgi:hypothetical protein